MEKEEKKVIVDNLSVIVKKLQIIVEELDNEKILTEPLERRGNILNENNKK